MAQLGAFQQQQQHLEDLQLQLQHKQQDLAQASQQQRIYQELVQAFGTNGIQAMMIENLLPQLEAETNHLLGTTECPPAACAICYPKGQQTPAGQTH